MMRLESKEIAAELMEITFGEKIQIKTGR